MSWWVATRRSFSALRLEQRSVMVSWPFLSSRRRILPSSLRLAFSRERVSRDLRSCLRASMRDSISWFSR